MHQASESRGPASFPFPLRVLQVSPSRVQVSRTTHWTQERAGAGIVEESWLALPVSLGGWQPCPLYPPIPGTHGHRWGSSAGAQGAGAGWRDSPPGWDTATGDSEGWEFPQAAAERASEQGVGPRPWKPRATLFPLDSRLLHLPWAGQTTVCRETQRLLRLAPHPMP